MGCHGDKEYMRRDQETQSGAGVSATQDSSRTTTLQLCLLPLGTPWSSPGTCKAAISQPCICPCSAAEAHALPPL